MQPLLFSIVQPLGAGDGDVPEFIHLVPAGIFAAQDGRGPFTNDDPAAVIAASMVGRKLAIDVNHAIDKRSDKGEEAPAVGWVVALETRADGIWGKVEWNAAGRAKVAGKEYGFISPVLVHSKGKPHRVTRILRASLTNDPALTGLASLNTNHSGDPAMEAELRAALGLAEDADQAAILAAVTSAAAASTAMTKIAKAAGLQESATGDEIVAAFTARGDATEVTQLRDQVKTLNTQLTTLVTNTAKERATAFVDQAIADLKVVPALRDHFIARHVKDPAEVEAEVKLMPSLNGGGFGNRRQVDGDAQLTDSDTEVCAQMGLDPKKFAETSKLLQKETF